MVRWQKPDSYICWTQIKTSISIYVGIDDTKINQNLDKLLNQRLIYSYSFIFVELYFVSQIDNILIWINHAYNIRIKSTVSSIICNIYT